MEMLEHVPDPQWVYFSACSKLVKPGGHVFFSTLNRNFKSYLSLLLVRKASWVCLKGTHDHEKFIRPAELIKMIDNTPLQELGITGLHYNPTSTDTYRLGSNHRVNYIVHTQNFAQ